MDRVRAWERGERIAPVTVDLALTRACNYACTYCLPPDEPVALVGGGTRAVSALSAGDRVISVDAEGNGVTGVVTHAWRTHPSRSTIEVRVGHRSLRCTPDHPILTPAGWRATGDIREGDYVAKWQSQRVAYASRTSGAVRTHATIQPDPEGQPRDHEETLGITQKGMGRRPDGRGQKEERQSSPHHGVHTGGATAAV